MRAVGFVALCCASCASAPERPPIRLGTQHAEPAGARAEPEPVPTESAPPPAASAEPRWHFAHPVVPRERTTVRVLMYHSFGWFSEMRPAVTPYAFRVQLDWLAENEVEVVPLGALLDFLDEKTELPERVAVITIDDGELNGYSVAYPILAERGIPFTLAIATEAVDLHRTRGTIPWATLREMTRSGLVDIASHSHSHVNLTRLDDAALVAELERSRESIERELGVRAEAFVFPLGAHDERVRRATQVAGYRAAFTAQGAPVRAGTQRFAIPRYGVEQSTSVFELAYFFRHQSTPTVPPRR